MADIKKTNVVLNDTNLADNEDTYIFMARRVKANQIGSDWTTRYKIHWVKYQIKETDMRQKTATFTSPQYFDLTTGVYSILITSKLHEDFGGLIISSEYDKNTGLYSYQCQDFSRQYQGKFELVVKNATIYSIIRTLITKNWGLIDNNLAKSYKRLLSGLRPAWLYDQSYYSSLKNFNPMTIRRSLIIRDKSWIEAIRDIIYGTGAYIDIYFDKYGILHLEPYHKDEFFNTGLYLTTPEIAEAKYKFDTTNIQTSVFVKNSDSKNLGSYYGSDTLLNLDLTAFFGDMTSMIANPTQNTASTSTNVTTSATKTASTKKSTTTTKNSNPYGTKKKVVYLNIDNISGKSADMKKMTDMRTLLQKNGWKVVITGVGPSTHYSRRNECKNGIWFTLYGGFCAGTLREQCTSDWFLNPLKKNKSRTVVGFFPPATNGILKGGKYYKHLGPAWDWQGSSSYANLDYPAKFMSQHGVPFMFGSNATQMVSKFLAGGDNYAITGNSYKYYDSWRKHDVKWIK